jgi:hypothetical protein
MDEALDLGLVPVKFSFLTWSVRTLLLFTCYEHPLPSTPPCSPAACAPKAHKITIKTIKGILGFSGILFYLCFRNLLYII